MKKTSNEIIKLNDNERQRRVYGVDGIAPTTILCSTNSAKILLEKNKAKG